MRPGSRRGAALVGAVVASALIPVWSFASTPGVPRHVALAHVGDGPYTRMFTTRFCEPGRCMDAIPSVGRSGSSLPVLTGVPGRQLVFDFGFAASSLRLTVRAGGVETTTVLATRSWDVPSELALPASIRLDAEGEGIRATYLALLDHVAPAPTVDRASKRRLPAATGPGLLEIRFRLCSAQAGEVVVTLGERRRGAVRVREQVVSTHVGGCASYRLRHRPLWRLPRTPVAVEIQASVGESDRSAPLRLR